MRTTILLYLSRQCLRNAPRRSISPFRALFRQYCGLPRSFQYSRFRAPPTGLGRRTVLLSLLTPAAFVQLSEDDTDDGKTAEEHMLAASREEISKKVPENVHGIRRAIAFTIYFLDQWIYEPIATGFRFLHLVIIFVPVIIAIPSIWIGGRHKDRHNERSGTLWWYGFLVNSMERAGPAFIKVAYHLQL